VAIAYAEEQLALAHETGDGHQTSVALNRLGVAMVYASDFAAARDWFEQSRDVARQAGANSVVGRSTVNLGWIALHDGDLDAAAALSVRTPSTIASAARMARAGPSKVAKKPSPAVSRSCPRNRPSSRRTIA
jgi:hypothetical protein